MDHLRRALSLAVIVLFFAAPLSGCSQSVKAAHASGLDDSIETLASGGVAVMDDFGSSTPIVPLAGAASAMRFTRWQVQNLVAEANGHAGYIGSELDALATPPPGAPPLSILIGAWLTHDDGALAQYANTFMGTQEYKHAATIVFPTIVVLTFIADGARVPATSLLRVPALDLARLIATPADAAPVCSLVAGWVSGVVNAVTSAIRANGSGWLASLWNTAVSIVGTAISVVINGLTQSLVGFITKIASICGTLMQVASLFKPWSVALAANPPAITLDPTAQPGAFDATLSATDIPWPAELVSCVSEISNNGVNLKDASYKDAPVTWTKPVNIPGLATKRSEDDTILDNKSAHYTYTTETVAAVAATDCPRLVPAGKAGITVTVKRSDITKTLNGLEGLITGQLNAAIQSYLQPYITPAVDAVTEAANTFAAPHESAIVTLDQNVADPLCTHTPPPNGTPPASTPAPSSVSGTLPFLPCTQMLQPDDIEPFMGGAYYITGAGAEGVAQSMGAMLGMAAKQSAGAKAYDFTRSSFCLLGTGSIPLPDPNDPNQPMTAKVAGMMMVTPIGSLPYMNPRDNGNGDVTSGCAAGISNDTLKRLNAMCVDINAAGGVTMVMVQGPQVQILIGGMSGAAMGPNGMTFPADGPIKTMDHLLKRYAP